MKKIIILCFLFSINVLAYDCESKVDFLDSIRIQQGHFSQTDTCYISISSRKLDNMVYRSFLITSRGKIHIFNSYGNGPSNTTTGAREFHIFPRSERINYEILESSVAIRIGNGDIFSFDIETADPVELGRGQLELDPVVSRNNQGGLEILNYAGLILDSGFKMGMSPTWYMERMSTFKDAVGHECRVKNNEIFDKKNNEVYWIYEEDAQLYKYLQKRCPSLTLEKI